MANPTRRIGDANMTEDEMSLTISGIKGGHRVSTGVNTPKTVGVRREEIYEYIDSERGISKNRFVGIK